MGEAILVFDVGTTNLKTMLFTMEGEPFFTLPAPFRPSYGAEGMVFQDPTDWRNGIVEGAAKAAAFAKERGIGIAALSLTASRSSVIPVDADGAHIGPAMMWQETASSGIVARVNRGGTLQRIFSLTGSRPNTVYSAPKMTWLRRNRPETYAKARKLAGIQDYLVAFFTGRMVTDHTFASRTLLMNIATREWDKTLLDIFEVEEEKLCRLIQPGSVAGELTPAAARITGLPSGLPVVSAGGDQNCAALGAGVIRRGDVMINSGTGSFLVAAVDSPVTDPGMRVMCNASAVPGKYVLDAGMLATGSAHRWFVENFYNEFADSQMREKYDKADAEAAAAEAGCGGLVALPHFSGCGAPHWESRAAGVFHGLAMGHRRGDLARAVYEGIAGEIAENMAVLAELVGDEPKAVLAGGLSRCEFFDQLLADVCRIGVRLCASREATARGAWSQAMVALGRAASHEEALKRGVEREAREFLPDGALAGVYAGLLERRAKLYACLAAMRE